MSPDRAAVDIDDLLKVILVLVVILLILEILDTLVSITVGLLGPFRWVLGLFVLAFIVLWILDKI